jgi:hypothetical protein
VIPDRAVPAGDPLARVDRNTWERRATVRLVGTATASFLVLFAAFPHRLEYAAHLLAGMGLAGAWAALLRSRLASPVAPFVLAAAVAVAGVAADLTLTGPLNVLDVANTAMGGLLGAAAVSAPPAEGADSLDRPLVVAGVLLVAAGFLLRYPVQDVAEQWWWFG